MVAVGGAHLYSYPLGLEGIHETHRTTVVRFWYVEIGV
jgi:hypothetical protein